MLFLVPRGCVKIYAYSNSNLRREIVDCASETAEQREHAWQDGDSETELDTQLKTVENTEYYS